MIYVLKLLRESVKKRFLNVYFLPFFLRLPIYSRIIVTWNHNQRESFWRSSGHGPHICNRYIYGSAPCHTLQGNHSCLFFCLTLLRYL